MNRPILKFWLLIQIIRWENLYDSAQCNLQEDISLVELLEKTEVGTLSIVNSRLSFNNIQ